MLTVGGSGCAPCTVIVPGINVWNEQKYGKLPALVNVCEKVWPCESEPELKAPSGTPGWPLVAVCRVTSLFIHVTVSPTATVGDGGANAKPLIAIFTVAARAVKSCAE